MSSSSQQEPSSTQSTSCKDFAETLKTTIVADKIKAAMPAKSHLNFFIDIHLQKLALVKPEHDRQLWLIA
jgi:phage gp16-like protein